MRITILAVTGKQPGWLGEAVVNDRFDIPALHETLDDARRELDAWQTWVLREPEPAPGSPGRLIGSVRGRPGADPQVWEIGRLMVAPDLQGRGLGRRLLTFVEELGPLQGE